MLQPFPYEQLWHYSEKFTRDKDLRQDLVLLAWKEDLRLADRSDIRLLKNLIKFRSSEIKSRSPLGVDISGKHRKDVWNHGTVSMSTIIHQGSGFRIEDTFSTCGSDPLGVCVVHDFHESLGEAERDVADGLIAGFNAQEIQRNIGMSHVAFCSTRKLVQEKAMEYLV